MYIAILARAISPSNPSLVPCPPANVRAATLELLIAAIPMSYRDEYSSCSVDIQKYIKSKFMNEEKNVDHSRIHATHVAQGEKNRQFSSIRKQHE